MTKDELIASLGEFAPETDLPLDSGILGFVLVLRSGDIDTFESCQGGAGHSFPEPTVKFHGNGWEGFKALAIAMTYRLPVLAVRLSWDVCDGMPHGPWWEMTFYENATEWANDQR